jgi:hypothetical protein
MQAQNHQLAAPSPIIYSNISYLSHKGDFSITTVCCRNFHRTPGMYLVSVNKSRTFVTNSKHSFGAKSALSMQHPLHVRTSTARSSVIKPPCGPQSETIPYQIGSIVDWSHFWSHFKPPQISPNSKTADRIFDLDYQAPPCLNFCLKV